MNYTLFAIAWYIIMRGLQVLFAGQAENRWFSIMIRIVTLVMLYAALASVIVWYREIQFLGFHPSK